MAKEYSIADHVETNSTSENTEIVTPSYSDSSAQDIAKELFPDEYKEINSENPEKEQEPLEDSNNESTRDDESLDDSNVDANGADEESDDEIPELNAEIAKLSPELQKRWEQQWQGILKRESKLERQRQELDLHKESISQFGDWAQGFQDKHRALEQFRELGRDLAQHHGYSEYELFGTTDSTKSDEYDFDNFAGLDEFNSDNDTSVYHKAKADALREFQAQMAPFMDELKHIKSEREQKAKEQQISQYINAIAPKTIKAIASADQGWEITPQMVQEAVTALEGVERYRDDPISAVRAYFSDERAKHLAKAKVATAPKAPEMLPTVQSRGRTIKSPENYSALDAVAELGLD